MLSAPPLVELADSLVLLRPYVRADVRRLFQAARESVPEVYRWLPWCHPHYELAEAEAWVVRCQEEWRQGREFCFVIADPASGEFCGGCALNQIDPLRMRANLGYWVRTSRTRQGLATAATRLLAKWGLSELRLQRIELVAAVDNLASQRVATKSGALREGVARRRLRVHDQPLDAVVYSLTADDFPPGSDENESTQTDRGPRV